MLSRPRHSRPASLWRCALTAALLLISFAGARADTITVTHWGDAFYGAPYAVAMTKGFFKARGVDITGILTSSGGGTSVRNTLAGDIPFGEVATSAALQAIRSGQPLVIVMSGVSTIADTAWVVRPDSPLKTLKDVIGHKVGYTSAQSVSDMEIRGVFKAAGIDTTKLTLVPAGGLGAVLSAVLNGAIDTGTMSEPLISQQAGKVRVLFYPRDYIPADMSQTVGITTREFAQAHPEIVRAIVAGRREGFDYMKAHPDETGDIMAKAYSMEPGMVRTAIRHCLAIGYWSDGTLDFAAMNHMVDGMVQVGAWKGPVDWAPIVDQSFLPGKDAAKTQ